VHAFPSSQTSGVPGVHVPAWHVSVPLQKLPSGHGAPSARGVCWQPVAGVQVSRVHGLPSSHGPGAVMTLRASSRPAPETLSNPRARTSIAPLLSACCTCAGVRQEFFESRSAATAATCGAAAEVPKKGPKQADGDTQMEVETPSKPARSGFERTCSVGK